MRISDWSSDVCSSDLARRIIHKVERDHRQEAGKEDHLRRVPARPIVEPLPVSAGHHCLDEGAPEPARQAERKKGPEHGPDPGRSEEHTSELQTLMRISYAVFCLNKQSITHDTTT